MIRVGIADFKGMGALRQKWGSLMDGIEAQDTTLVAHIRGKDIAFLAARPMMWIHDLHVSPEYSYRIQQRGVEALLQYTLGWGPAAPRLIVGGLFQIATSNDRMEAIANSLGGAEEADSRIFRVDL